MAVRIVTDSTCDLPPEILKELDIAVLPTYLLFGTTSYRDGLDINTDEFYQKLLHEPVYPTTSQPTPQDFLAAFSRLSAAGADGIVSIHLSSKLSGTANAAEKARQDASLTLPIEVIDSQTLSFGLGLVVIAAARMAKAGKSLKEITEAVHHLLDRNKLLILFDTLEYLAKGGRIGKVSSLLGALLSVKPLATIKDGELVPSCQVRSRAKGKEKLLEFINSCPEAAEVFVAYSTTPDEAKELAAGITVCPPENIRVSRLGPVIAAHGGPGLLGIAIQLKSEPPGLNT